MEKVDRLVPEKKRSRRGNWCMMVRGEEERREGGRGERAGRDGSKGRRGEKA